MTKSFTIIENKSDRSNFTLKTNFILIFLLIISVFILLLTTIIFSILWRKQISSSSSKKFSIHNGTIGFPPLLPNDGKYIQWNILHLNDVYEMLPLDKGRRGGLPRLATLKQLLLEENSHTFIILAGDFLSPSALSQSIVNETILSGKQMIASFNTLGLDFVTFGNHEFDLNESELISRMNESTFKWISSNVFQNGKNESFFISIPYHLITIDQIKILFIGLTIEIIKPYINIIDESKLIPFVKQFLESISDVKYDVLIALTHLDIGHEHEDYYLLRGSQLTPIYKSDGNAFTVIIHRCAFNVDTKRLRIYSTLAKVTPEISDEPKTNEVANYWFNLGMKAFEEMGYEPNKTVSCLPSDVELDGRSASIRSSQTLLSTLCCKCMIDSTSSSETTVGVFNSGSIRIDDFLRGTITQYDILRTLPYPNNLFALSVHGEILANALIKGASLKGNGMFLSYSGVETSDEGKTWFINGTDISKSGLRYNLATISYAKENVFNDTSVTVLQEYNITQTASLINYLPKEYPPC